MIGIISTIFVIALIIFIAYYLFMWPKSAIFGFYPCGIKTDRKVIALSFDDGPSLPYTADLLKILAEHEVKASFFLVGKNLEKFPELGRAILSAGHVIGNHAYSHNLFKYITSPSLRDEVAKTQEIILKETGKRAALFRSPWLIRHPGLFRMAHEKGLALVSGFFGTQKEVWQVSAETIFKDACAQIAPGRILIFHDGFTKNGNRSETVRAMGLFIPELKKRGYELVTVSELLDIPAYNI